VPHSQRKQREAHAHVTEGGQASTPQPVAPRSSQPGQLGFGLFMLLVLSLVCAPFFINTVAQDAPRVIDGRLDLSRWGDLEHPVALEGSWSFTWLGPAKVAGPQPTGPFPVPVPGVWEGVKTPQGATLPGRGRARYSLTITGLAPGEYRIAIPTIYMANQVSIDGRVVGRQGVMGWDAASTRYHWRAHDLMFRSEGRPVTITIENAAFLHRDTGIEQAPVIGTPRAVGDWLAIRWSQELLFHVSLVLMGLFSLVAYVFRRADWPSLFFAICCFGLLPFSAIIGVDNLLLMGFPSLGLLPMMAILYQGTVGALGCFLIYTNALFPAEAMRWPFRVALGAVVLLFIAQALAFLTGDTWLVSKVNANLIYVVIIEFTYINVLMVRATWRRRPGAAIFLIGMATLFASLIILSVVGFGIIPSDQVPGLDLVSYGMLVLLFSHMVVLAERWSLTTLSAEALSRDLRQMIDVTASITSEIEIDAVLRRIVEGTSQVLRAERSSLFIYDDRKHQLWTMVAEGLDEKSIRVPADKGIVGRCFASGEVTIVDDPYADPDFLREQDAASGFRTRNMIALPLITRDGRKIGVLQALNHIGGGSFDRSDAESMRAFSSQAAVALDNARLFSEVTASRNYSASVLRSMSNGVVTIDKGGKVTGLNDAACVILRIAPDDVDAHDWQSWIALHNPIVLDEIRNVSGSGSSKTLLDIDVRTVPGVVISANVSIVPLMGEKEEEGLLLIVEDISSGKRLEGAMRRFMTQEVMDQVLSQQGDLMFGTACSASVLFADIRNFTTLAESLSPRETVDMLNEIFTDLFDAVSDYGGVLDKYIGDAVMAVFGAPLTRGDDAQNAVRSALRMQEMMESINNRRLGRGEPALRLGIGIASGDVVAGTIGSPKRMDYTVIGDSVNLAARLQDLTKTYGCDIIVCERTAQVVAEFATLDEIDRIQVKGRITQERIFSVQPALVDASA
jgi:adenylate cyclase